MTTTRRMLAPLRSAARIIDQIHLCLLRLGRAAAPAAHADEPAEMLAAVRTRMPLPADDQQAVQANGAVQALGGALLARAGRYVVSSICNRSDRIFMRCISARIMPAHAQSDPQILSASAL